MHRPTRPTPETTLTPETSSTRSPLRLVVMGALLLWVLTPLLLGGLITVEVRTQESGHIGPVLGIALVLWSAAAVLVLLAGFALIIAGVFAWWRANHADTLVETSEDSASG